MAQLAAKEKEVVLTLRPYRIAEVGEPTWLLTQLEVRHGTQKLISTSINLTKGDLHDLRAGLGEICSGLRDAFSLTSSDDDFIFQVVLTGGQDDVAIGFWVGEPYDLMTGYRFVAELRDVEEFCNNLGIDESTVAPPAHLP